MLKKIENLSLLCLLTWGYDNHSWARTISVSNIISWFQMCSSHWSSTECQYHLQNLNHEISEKLIPLLHNESPEKGNTHVLFLPVTSETRKHFSYFCRQCMTISIFHGCIVWIDKSVTRVTVRHHKACRMIPNSDPEWQIFLTTPYTHERYFFLHTFWFTIFDFQSRTCYKVTLLPLKSFYTRLKKSMLPATTVRFSTLTSNLHKVTSFFDVNAVKTNITWWRRYVTSYITNALNSRDFYPVLSEITWVRLELSVQVKHADILIRYARNYVM